MKIGAEFTFCSIDNKTTDTSRAYKMLRRLLGKRLADRLTYTVAVPPHDDCQS